jgi:hypothetical protein
VERNIETVSVPMENCICQAVHECPESRDWRQYCLQKIMDDINKYYLDKREPGA